MGEPSYLAAVRESYDTVAGEYARRYPASELAPLGRAILGAFAEVVRGPVADLGCGPGGLTALLAELGVAVSGVDISPEMIGEARRAHPHLRFSVGSMTALDISDGALGGILAHYSTHHTPPEWLPAVFAEFERTLAPGGHAMLATYIGADEHLRPTHSYGGHRVSYESYLLPGDRIAALLAQAGLTVTVRLDVAAKWSRTTFLMRKP
ncbi:class I SAM-dependent methyltransferase [Amycolatopsis sp. GM8]|uniref:class I SAM-dependent DNA methyltransferase n=1 Tax=Amycolatopsis sp. GM8 TaxID=2896530 RepID=UPI001F203F8C|nr:class I SAM-dependent methyltransferase [Amycolatopsis sp. GM8]